MERVMVILAVVVLLIGLGYVIKEILREARKHKMFVTGGLIRVICPRSVEISTIATRTVGMASLPCPNCGRKLMIPDRKNRWTSVEDR